MKDCGVSCIQMILKYYGGYLDKNTLLEMTKTDKRGTTAYNIKETLTNLGFSAKGVSCNLNDINSENIIFPCIANVIINDSYKHFIVIYEINFKRKFLIIGDPADKVKKITYDEFSTIFNNVLITFYPLKKLPIIKHLSCFKFIINLLKMHKKLLLNIFLLSIFITLFSIVTTFYTEYMLSGINYYSFYYLLFVFCIFFSIYILKIFTDYFRNKLLAFLNQKISLVFTLDVFNKIIKLPYRYYRIRTTGDIVSRINDLDNVKNLISKMLLSLFVDLPLALISLIVLFIINKFLFLISFFILILYFVIIVLFRGFLNDYIKKVSIDKSNSISYIVESINGFEAVKGTQIEDSVINKFEKNM